jgi:diguanylate cyclase (GGDEF)-like protein
MRIYTKPRIIQTRRLKVEVVGLVKTLMTENLRLEQLVTRDPLTGVLNRRGFEERYEEMLAGAVRHGRSFTLAMLDIDHFKKINDTHGHKAGDLVLQQIAQIIDRSLRADDIFARVGGEEFVIILNETSFDNARVPLERIRKRIGEAVFTAGPGTIKVTVSMGFASYSPAEGGGSRILTPEQARQAQILKEEKRSGLVEEADKQLYRAKNSGRNRIFPD